MSERWKLGWLESYNAYTGEPERFVYRPGDDEHTRICVRGENCDEDARRIVASVNAALDIPTETLERGVVVVPEEVARRTIGSVEGLLETYREHRERCREAMEQAADDIERLLWRDNLFLQDQAIKDLEVLASALQGKVDKRA